MEARDEVRPGDERKGGAVKPASITARPFSVGDNTFASKENPFKIASAAAADNTLAENATALSWKFPFAYHQDLS